MSSAVPSRAAPPRRSLTPLSTGWLIALPALTGAAWLTGYHDRVPPLAWPALGAIWLATLALVLRRGRHPSLGPVFLYDLVRSSRRGEPIAHRCLYAGLLVGALFWSYWAWFPDLDLADPLRSLTLPSLRERARFAGSFFAGFMVLQLVVVLLFTPIYVAGAIADEKERRTLQFLLVTDLRDREIVLGVLASRLARLLLLVLTGLPVLSLLPLLGGVDPALVLAGFAATGALMLSLGSIAILMSVKARTSLGAVVGTYLWLPVLLLVALCPYPVPAAHPVWAAVLPGAANDPSRTWAGLWAGLLAFGIQQALVTLCCCRAAVQGLRGTEASGPAPADRAPAPRRPGSGPQHKPGHLPDRPRPRVEGWGPFPEVENRRAPAAPINPRPPVGANALLWKEMYVERHFGPADWKVADPLPVICLAAALLLVLLPIGWVTNRQTDGSFGEQVQPLVQYLGSGLGCVLLLIVALSAAGRISREKERRTLGPLLVLPVSRWDILFTKWLGSLLSVRGPLLVLAALWGLGCVAGALDVFAVLLLAAAWGVCAGFLASLGLWLSAVCGSTLRANLLTFLAALVFAASPLRAAGVFLIDTPQGMPVEYEWVDSFLEHLLNPGGILGTFSFRAADLVSVAKGDGTLLSIWTALAALYVYLAAIPVLWLATLARLDAGEGAADGRKSEGAVASDPRASV